MPVAGPGPEGPGDSAPEQAALAKFQYYQDHDSGYSKQQSTRPADASATASSTRRPAQAAWILEKFWAWTDNDGHPEDAVSRDELLDNVMFYWLNGTGASSARLYWESFNAFGGVTVPIPTGVSQFPKEIITAPRALGRARLHRHPLLERARPGRPLRRVRGARPLRRARSGPSSAQVR